MKKKTKIRRIAAAALTVFMAVTTVFGAAAAEKKEKYTFTYNEQQVETGMAANAALKALGKEKDTKILTNCAEDGGKDKAYLYDDFDVVVTKSGKKEVVKQISLKTDKVSTEEGIKIGDLPAAVKKAYPDAKAEVKGLYVAELGETRIVIDCGLKDDKVEAITYEAVERK